MKSFNKEIGNLGENISKEYLIKSGYTILEKNFRCKIGEIDIIAKDMNYICFVEVKTRHGDFFGSPCEAVNYLKQQKISRSAEMYIMKNRLFNCLFRFDVIEVVLDKNESYSIKHIKNAFQT